jgi:hypothetical protein
MNQVDAKDPDETKYYAMDWSASLNTGATISASSWTVGAGITAGTTGTTGAITRVLLSSGTHLSNYVITNRITTSDGETLERSGIVRVRTL